ncbi:MAG: acetylornithine transaminase [Spirochaetia bacterium]|nr:acetylornithine transaminase [Spirochaetia bacterium]
MSNWIDRSKKVLMNTYSRFPITLTEGAGVYAKDDHGGEYLDFLAGIAVNALGHAHPALSKAISEQAQKMLHCSNLYHIPQQTKLAEKLVQHSSFDKVFFCNSGTEAIESALKLARKWGKTQKNGAAKIIAMEHSFHGRTIGALSLTGQEKYQKSFKPLMPEVEFVPFNDIDALSNAVDEDSCAVILEPVQGEGGIFPARQKYLQEVRRICSETDTLLLFDEVQCGLGRTGTLFAHQYYEVEPDAVALAKGLGGGFPIGALLAKERVAVFEPGDHASTFGGNPLASAASLALLTELTDGGVVKHSREVGAYLHEKLSSLATVNPRIKEIRGVNLMIGIQLDRDAGPYVDKCHKEGLLVGKAGPDVLRLVPPLIIEKEHIDTAVDILTEVLGE